jgi:DUF1680 family protein/enterochelin esterase-like enzyme
MESKSQSISNMPFTIIAPIPEKLEWFPLGEIKPSGWLKAQMQKDMHGFVGHLDELVPDLMADSIYGKDRLTRSVKSKNVGNIGQEMDPQYLWWNSETQSNWWDGYIRNAILLNDKAHLAKAEKHVKYILSTQDQDGYLGIYAKDLRYNFQDENGELWAKTTILRGLLAWYEYTGKPEILAAIEKTVADVMKHYPAGNSSPFKSVKPFAGGVTHGLVFTDILDRLYQITGNKTYLDYALFLYRDFSGNVLSEDAQYPKIMDSNYKLKEHGVHTYEHLRPLTMAWYASGNPSLKSALDKYLQRIRECTTPAGGPIGDEWVGGRKADATQTGYEYCSIQELMDGYCNLMQKTGDPQFGEEIENIFFNAAQGARHPDKSCIAYCKTDNSFSMTGTKNGEPNGREKQTRFKYSPAHQDVAVCCVPNAGRITPYYIRSMWMKDSSGLIASLPGPCELQTTVNGQKVRIVEETRYPFADSILYHVSADQPVTFELKIRKPAWAKSFTLNCAYRESNGFIIIHQTWKGLHTIRLDLSPGIEVKKDPNQEYYYKRGALIFALPIEGREVVSKIYPVAGLMDLQYQPVSKIRYEYYNKSKPEIVLSNQHNPEKVWQSIALKTTLVNETTGKTDAVTLRPLGATILRQMTFPAAPLNLASGRVQRLKNFKSAFVDARNVDVWLPEGYSEKKKYAVLYMHDGQMLYDSATTWNKQEWGVDEVVGKLIAERKIRDCIVVGVWNNVQYRHIEYFPQKALEYLTPAEKTELLNTTTGEEKKRLLFDGPVSDNYLKFLVRELKPAIDSSFSTLADRQNTFIAGSSMGGLISMYAICEYPGIFGGAACISTHWPGTFKSQDNPVPGAFLTYLKNHLPSPKDHKIYFDFGSATLDAMYKPYQQQADVIMKAKGFTSENWITKEFPGEDHSERAWRKRLDIPLVFLLGK